MKTFTQVMVALELSVKRIEEYKHRVAFLKADNRFSDYEKMAKARTAIRQVKEEADSVLQEVASWLEESRKGGRGDWDKRDYGVTVEMQSEIVPTNGNSKYKAGQM